jgi:hypothetical protein
VEGAWAGGAGPAGGDGDRLAMLCWAYLIRSASGPAGQVVLRVVRASGRNGHQVVTVEAGARTLEHGAQDAAGLCASGN